jgi:hypothetical protein
MNSSYSSYKNDLISFNSEEYIKNLVDSISYKYFYNFIKIYKEIENEDFKKPIFSQTTKFKKIPNNYKNYKFLKINRDNDEFKNSWTLKSPTEESEKISMLIKTYLNKISNETYKKISVEFLDDLLKIENKNMFYIVSSEIINKCLFDNKYRNIYMNLCQKIWSNKQIHYNLVNIINIDNNYYWEYKSDVGKKYGPFSSEINAKNNVYSKINFKKYFLNYIQKLYVNKNTSFDDLNEEEAFINKKKIIMLLEIIAILYLEKHINFDIINIIIIDLLHLNFKNNGEVNDVEVELLYTLIKTIKKSKTSFTDLLEYKNIINEYTKIILEIINKINISKRSLFFLNDITIMFNEFINNNNNNNNNNNIKKQKDENICEKSEKSEKSEKKEKIVDKKIITELLKENNTKELLNLYKIDNYNFINILIDIFISHKNINKSIINILHEVNNTKLIFSIIEKITINVEDIMLDIPDANIKILHILNSIQEISYIKTKLINTLNNLDLHSDEETDSDEEN